MASSWARNSALFLIFSGCTTGMPAAAAASFTGGATLCRPRPLGLSGCVTARTISWPARKTALNVGTANDGVPQKTTFIPDLPSGSLPLAGLLQLANLAQDQVALQGAHALEKQDAIQVIDFMLEGARQKLFPLEFKPFAACILSADLHLRRARNLFANVRETQAALFFILLAFAKNNLRINENDLIGRLLLKAQVDYGDAFRNSNLRSSEADAFGCIHRLEHIVHKFTQFFIELGDGLGGALQNWLGIFNDL